jgi:DNA-binding XRE family transcriptional regulator
MAEVKSSELSKGERLLIDRRRRGERQGKAASRLKVPLSRYSLWERDLLDGAPKVSLGQLKAHERCVIYRRRCGKSQVEVAQELEVCRWWLNQMEAGTVDCTPLACYWEQ